MKTEVEIRAFISRGQYLKLLRFFKKNDKKIKQDFQETIYFSGKKDLRIQKNQKYSKIWLKSGKIHDNARDEIEIIVPRSDFQKLLNLFSMLGYKIAIKWLRRRSEFNWRGINVCLDYTKGYGYIIELEKVTTVKNHQKLLKELKEKLRTLGIKETPKKEFGQKFTFYKKNWKKLIGENNES